MTERQSNHPTGLDLDRYFLSCDWGTTSFRLRLVETATLRVAAELKNKEGIAATFQLWLSSQKPASERLAFYRSILETKIAALQASLKGGGESLLPDIPSLSDIPALSGIPLLLSGMASSSIGMQELPYKELPFNTNGEDLQMALFEATSLHPHSILLLSGVRSMDDVMRGEETQLIGCFPLSPPEQAQSGKSQGGGEHLFIFPGTHSKHVRVRGNQVVGLRTYMTGEYFHLLTKHSILAASVAESIAPAGNPNSAGIPGARNPFEQGVLDSIDANLLHQSFQVRTHHLLGTMSKEDNYHYLSGLLIGSECKDLAGAGLPLTLVSGEALQDQYTRALQTLGITDIELQPLDQAVIRGHAHLRKSFLGK